MFLKQVRGMCTRKIIVPEQGIITPCSLFSVSPDLSSNIDFRDYRLWKYHASLGFAHFYKYMTKLFKLNS